MEARLAALFLWESGREPDPAAVAEILALRTELDGLALVADAGARALKGRIEALGPSHASEVLLASALRILQKLEEESAERERALGPRVR